MCVRKREEKERLFVSEENIINCMCLCERERERAEKEEKKTLCECCVFSPSFVRHASKENNHLSKRERTEREIV